MDVHTRETRSYNMSQIKGKNTKPEETVRKYLFGRGLRYRKNDKRLPGHPDIVLPKYKTVDLVRLISMLERIPIVLYETSLKYLLDLSCL